MVNELARKDAEEGKRLLKKMDSALEIIKQKIETDYLICPTPNKKNLSIPPPIEDIQNSEKLKNIIETQQEAFDKEANSTTTGVEFFKQNSVVLIRVYLTTG